MTNNPYVVFTQRAFNAIITETIDKNPIETGGIFIGYVLDNGVWIVVETIPPGYKTIHKRAYFEYDTEFVNYLSNIIAQQYKGNLQVLGLWHRHPGSMDTFSTTDDETNLTFAREKNCGSISALVNCDPQMRLTMYHVDQQCNYRKIEWFVDDEETIPKDFLALCYPSADEFPILNERGIVHEEIATHESVAAEQAQQAPVSYNEAQGAEEYTEAYTLSNVMTDLRSIIKKISHK